MGADAWNAELRGTLKDVDLDQLVTGHFPHKLSGLADVQIQRSVWRGGRLRQVRGQLQVQGGVISSSLLQAARDHLRLALHQPPGQVMLVRYRQLNLQFALDGRRLSLAGRADQQGTVLVGEQGALLSSQADSPVQPISLLRLLVPANRFVVPATAQTAGLVNLLPLPPLEPDATGTARVPYVPLRLRTR
jgi:hypothetical protein